MQRSVASSAPVDATDQAFAQAHATLVRDKAFQFDRADFVPPQRPEWLDWIATALEAMAPILKWAFWISVAIIVGLILFAVIREIVRLRAPLARPTALVLGVEPEWRPDAAAARDLLAAADALAAQGRFTEAAHLILLRSVEDIESRRPRSVRPALTTREIASLSALPAAARPAFASIGALVERSLFGGVPVEDREFKVCRGAYEAFALPAGWTA